MIQGIRLKRLSLSGFRSFLEESSIVFPSSGLMGVQGVDIRTGGSNGSGKSSLIEAIYWNLGLNALPTTELQNKKSTGMSVTLEIETSSGVVVSTRTQSKLAVTVNGTPIQGGKADVEKELHKIISFGHQDVLEVLSYRRQSSGGFFSSSEDSKIKSFLSTCIPSFDNLEKVQDSAKSKIQSFESDLKHKDQEIALQEHYISSISPVTREVDAEDRIINAEKQMEALSGLSELSDEERRRISSLNTAKAERAAYLTQVSSDAKPSDEVLAEYRSFDSAIAVLASDVSELTAREKRCSAQIEALGAAYKVHEKELSRAENAELAMNGIQSQINELLVHRGHLAKNVCFTCQREWGDAAAGIEKLDKQIDALQNNLSDLKVISSKKPSILEALALVEAQKKALVGELTKTTSDKNVKDKELDIKKSEQRSVMTRFAKSVEDGQRLIKSELSAISFEIDSLESKGKMLKAQKTMELKGIIDILKRSIDLHNKYIAEKSSAESKLQKLLIEKAAIGSSLEFEQDVFYVVKSVNGMMMDGILSEVQEKSNYLLGSVPNASDISISLSSISEMKNGASKVKISMIIYKGANIIPFKALSGGQKSSVSLALDLAFIEAISRRTQIRPLWLVLDEAMEGMDIGSKESALEMIKLVSKDKLVIVVDHSSEIKEQFDHSVMVEFDGNTSRLT